MLSIALKMLIADRGKLLTAMIGVIFSVVLVNVQGGLFVGLIRKASLLVDHGNADIWVGHKKMHNVDLARNIPRRWIHRIRSVPGVSSAEPYIIAASDMTLPSGGFEGVFVIGVEPTSLLGNAWAFAEGDAMSIRLSDGIIVDSCEDDRLESPRLGDVREIGGHRARVVAKSHGIAGFLVTPYVFTTIDRAARYTQTPVDVCSYFLVQLERGANAEQACAAIRGRLPEVEVLTRNQYSWVSIQFWLTRTGLGISFGAATLLGLLVGLVMVAQTMYAMVLDRLAEFGTLKTIGASDQQIYTVLLCQALVIAAGGSCVALIIVALVQHFFDTPRAPIVIPCWLSLGSCMLVSLMCLISSIFPYLRIRRVDAQTVLQS